MTDPHNYYLAMYQDQLDYEEWLQEQHCERENHDLYWAALLAYVEERIQHDPENGETK